MPWEYSNISTNSLYVTKSDKNVTAERQGKEDASGKWCWVDWICLRKINSHHTPTHKLQVYCHFNIKSKIIMVLDINVRVYSWLLDQERFLKDIRTPKLTERKRLIKFTTSKDIFKKYKNALMQEKIFEELITAFHQKYIQLTSKHMKICSMSLLTIKWHIKTTITCLYSHRNIKL